VHEHHAIAVPAVDELADERVVVVGAGFEPVCSLVVGDVDGRRVDACMMARESTMMARMAAEADTASAMQRFASMLASAPDANAPVPGLTWTVADLGAHVLALTRQYRRGAEDRVPGWRDLREGPAENARLMSELVSERDVRALASGIEEGASELERAWGKLDPNEAIPWHGQLELPVHTVADLVFGDVLVHTFDLSRAIKAPYKIGHDDAVRSFAVLADVAPHFVNYDAAAGFRGVYDIALRGGPRYAFAFDDAQLTITEGKPARADCRINADPATLLLSSEGRVGQAGAAITGKVVAYGRKPWLAFKLNSLLVNP
jgi:hypothetical protein